MKHRILLALAFALLATSCGKDKESGGGGEAAKPIAPTQNFKTITGITIEAENVCPFEELEGFYKVGSSNCTYNGEKAAVDYIDMPTRYQIMKMPPVRGAEPKGMIEVIYTRDGQENHPIALEFPRVQNATHTRKTGVQCASDAAGGTLVLHHACVGTSVNGGCFDSIVKKDNKLVAITSRVRQGVQYWCRSNLRKVEEVPAEQ